MKSTIKALSVFALLVVAGCGGSSGVPPANLTPELEAQVAENDKAVEEAESALGYSKRQ